ncbi:MAG: ribosome maturation factor RimM [Chitinophagaceae bacterium]
MTNYINIGKIAATHGISGEMIIIHNLGKKTDFKDIKAFFIEDLPGSFLPYFPTQIKAKTDAEVLVIMEGIQTKEKARTLLQKQIWITEEDFSKYASASAPITLLGYMVLDGEESLGEVLEVIEQPHQILCRIQYKEHDDILIPLNEQSIQKIDRKHKKLFLELPSGLIESQL